MTYPLKFRLHLLAIKKQEGLSYAEASKRFAVGARSIQRWEKAPHPKPQRNRPATKIDRRALEQDVRDYPDAYQYERAQRLGASQRGIGDALKRLGLTRKKKPTAP